MKIRTILFRLLAFSAVALSAATAHAHGERKVAGPNGGRIINTVEPRAEFFVMPDRKVQITFLDEANKPVAPAEQIVTVTAGERSAPKTLTFSKSGDALVSHASIPEGDQVPTVVQIKVTPDAKTVTDKFNLNLATCGECKHAEYACICGH